MDEEPNAFLAYQPYKGPANIPHVPAEFFGAFFLAVNVGDLYLCIAVLAFRHGTGGDSQA
jgi:hypothetical protein